MIWVLLAYIVWDYLGHEWDAGWNVGYQEGYKRGIAQPPQTWKTLAPTIEID